LFRFSILIPTYNRLQKLQSVLHALSMQEGVGEGEVIVGVDGSEDGTEEWLGGEGWKGSKGNKGNNEIRNLSWFRIENSGRAVIRNRLLERAKGEIVIFIQDDIVVTEGWLQAHLAAHELFTGAVIGHVTWYPQMEVTPYMRWLEQGGHLLDFGSLRDGQETDFWHFYMGNISIDRGLLEGLRFDETSPTYGWEDIVFGYEFVRRGGRVSYCEAALAYHWDDYREEDLETYMMKVAESAVWAEERYPGLGFVPSLWKKAVFRTIILSSRPVWRWLPQELRWYVSMKKYFLKSI